MRQAREAESAPYLIATLVPLGPLNVKLRIHNAGRGPAIDIKAVFWLEPANDTEATTWLHPVLLSNTFEDFVLPGRKFAFEKLAAQHDRVVVNLQWFNAFKRKYDAKYEIDLKRQKEGWYEVGFLMQPDDIPTQLGQIRDELSRIRSYLDRIESERKSQAFHLWSSIKERIALGQNCGCGYLNKSNDSLVHKKPANVERPRKNAPNTRLESTRSAHRTQWHLCLPFWFTKCRPPTPRAAQP